MPLTSPSLQNTSNISALTDYDHSDLSDPWESAAHFLSPDRHVDAEAHDRASTTLANHAEQSCQASLRIMLQKLFRIFDGIGCVLLLLWAGIILLSDDRSSLPRVAFLLQGSVSILLLTRIAADCCTLCCSLALSLLYAALALYGGTEAPALHEYLQDHHWLHLPGLEHHVDRLPIVLLALAAWELLVRWGLQRCIVAHRGVEEPEDDNARIRSTSRQPWWWDRRFRPRRHPTDDRMARPLLDHDGLPDWVVEGRRQGTRDEDDHGEGHHWFRWPWSRRHADNDAEGRGVRDDGSVDFASVQEEWATRSVEDPHWWSKEDDRTHNTSG